MKEELAISQGFGFERRKSTIGNKDEIETTETSDETLHHSTVTKFIQDRYRNIVDNSINSVLFIILRHDNGVEVSGHIDLNQRFTDDPNFQKYLKGLRQMSPQQGDLTYHHWTKGKTLLSNSDNWEVITDSGAAKLRNRHSGDLVSLSLRSSRSRDRAEVSRYKRRGKSESKKSSTMWAELDTDPDAGLRIMYWDIYLCK